VKVQFDLPEKRREAIANFGASHNANMWLQRRHNNAVRAQDWLFLISQHEFF